jgi:acyl-CoA synthetase (AMP-forming)/AMP-acid ligase II
LPLEAFAMNPRRHYGLDVNLRGLVATVPEAITARRCTPDNVFVMGSGFRLTFDEADRQSATLAGRLLGAGIGKGTRVGLLYPNSAEWAVAWLAITRIGALSVPLSTFSPGIELAATLRHGDVHTLLMGSSFAGESMIERLELGLEGLRGSSPVLELASVPFLRSIYVDGRDAVPSWTSQPPPPFGSELVQAAEAEVFPADALAIIYTSGATAAPKAVVHSQASLVRHAALLAEYRDFTPLDRIYSPMPFFWVGGLTMVLLAALVSGAGAVVQERFEPGEALDLIESNRVTQISCWPNAARQLAEHPTFDSRDLTSVRGGTLVEALPLEYRPPTRDRAPIPLGMTETGGPHTGIEDPYRVLPEDLRGTFGKGVPGMEHLVAEPGGEEELVPAIEEGEIFLRGHFLMEGFYKTERHDTFTPDGWYNTNDLGWFGTDGNLRFTGRQSSMIKSGGSNVSPAEVEKALLQQPGIRAAFVFGIPSGDRGEDVAAIVVPEDPQVRELPELPGALRQSLSSFKIPKRIRVLPEADLPKLPTGKTDLVALRNLLFVPQ